MINGYHDNRDDVLLGNPLSFPKTTTTTHFRPQLGRRRL